MTPDQEQKAIEAIATLLDLGTERFGFMVDSLGGCNPLSRSAARPAVEADFSIWTLKAAPELIGSLSVVQDFSRLIALLAICVYEAQQDAHDGTTDIEGC